MLKNEINKALEVIKAGGIILYPTDTIWGIGCDATNPQAVQKIIDLKQRATNKSFIVLLDTVNKLPSYVNPVPEIAYNLIEFAENPLTIIYSGAKNLAQNVMATDGSVGIRVVKHQFCNQLIQRFRKPIVSTSANLSGQIAPHIFTDIDLDVIDFVDYIIDLEQDNIDHKNQSTIMKLEADGRFKFIRN